MVPQPQAAIAKPRPKPAPLGAEACEKRWPRFWTVFSALAASAVLWALIYLAVTLAAGLVDGAFR